MASGDSGLSNAKAEGIRIRHIVRAEVDAIRECIGIALQAFRRMAILSKFEVQWYSPPNGNLTARRQMADVATDSAKRLSKETTEERFR
jgi:hypothetical protein